MRGRIPCTMPLAAFSESYVVVLGIYYKLQTFLYLPASRPLRKVTSMEGRARFRMAGTPIA